VLIFNQPGNFRALTPLFYTDPSTNVENCTFPHCAIPLVPVPCHKSALRLSAEQDGASPFDLSLFILLLENKDRCPESFD
jgi:hypothetical protein